MSTAQIRSTSVDSTRPSVLSSVSQAAHSGPRFDEVVLRCVNEAMNVQAAERCAILKSQLDCIKRNETLRVPNAPMQVIEAIESKLQQLSFADDYCHVAKELMESISRNNGTDSSSAAATRMNLDVKLDLIVGGRSELIKGRDSVLAELRRQALAFSNPTAPRELWCNDQEGRIGSRVEFGEALEGVVIHDIFGFNISTGELESISRTLIATLEHFQSLTFGSLLPLRTANNSQSDPV